MLKPYHDTTLKDTDRKNKRTGQNVVSRIFETIL